MAAVQGGLIRVVIAQIGELRAIHFGLVLNVLCLVLYALAPSGWMIWVLIPISACGSIVAPALQAILSRAAGPERQGELQGVLSSINGLAMVLSPLIMTQTFFFFTRSGGEVHMPGAPFLLAAVLMAAAYATFAMSRREGRDQPA